VTDELGAAEQLRAYEERLKPQTIIYVQAPDGKPLSHPGVMESIGQASQAEVMPHVYHRSDVMTQADADAVRLRMTDGLRQQHFGDAVPMGAQEVLDRLALRSSLRTQVPSRYVITLQDGPGERDSLRRIAAMNSPSSPISFVALDEPSANARAPTRKAHYSRLLTSSSSDVSDGPYYSPEGAEFSIYFADTYLYITPDIFTGIMCGLFIFFTILIGLSCLSAIQTPSSFATKNPAVGREA
jgi:hypothetical protein